MIRIYIPNSFPSAQLMFLLSVLGSAGTFTVLGKAKPSYVYQNPFLLHGCLLCWAKELTKLPQSEPVMTP